MTDPQWQPTTITTLESIWPLLEEPLQQALQPHKAAAVWFRGVLPLWPPLGIMVENVDAQQAVTAILEAQKVSSVLVLSRLDASKAGLWLDAYHLPLEQLVAAYLSFTRATASLIASTAKMMESMKLDAMTAILWQLMASCRAQKPLAACTPAELDMVQADATNAVATVLARLAQPGAPVLQSQQPQEPPGPSAATAPLQLPSSPSPVQASPFYRPMGYADRVAGERLQTVQWWEGWYGHQHRYL